MNFILSFDLNMRLVSDIVAWTSLQTALHSKKGWKYWKSVFDIN